MLRYKCLLLDHDDTVVNSTPNVHYPSFCKALEILRPGVTLSLEDYVLYNCAPGFTAMCRDILGFSDEEIIFQDKMWKADLAAMVPPAWDGMKDIICRHKAEGGFLGVVSHSCDEYIRRDYLSLFGVEPDVIYGWELGEGQRKPSPYPLLDIMENLGFAPHEMLMVDDLTPGCEMASACGVHFAYAGWSAVVPELRDSMKRHSKFAFDTVAQFYDFLFGQAV